MIEWDILLYITAFPSPPPCHRFAESSAFRSPFFHFHFAGIHRDEHITFQPLCAMCMFLVCVNPAAASDEFALVVVSIRDEYFTRPTRLVSFWKEDPRIIGGERNMVLLARTRFPPSVLIASCHQVFLALLLSFVLSRESRDCECFFSQKSE